MAVAGTISNDGSGNLTYTGAAGINNTLKIAQSGSNTTFNEVSAGTITNNFGSGSGGGTATVTIATANITSITVDLADGTNVLNLQYANVATAFNPSAGTNTLNISSNAPTNAGTTTAIAANVTVAPSGGTVNVTIGATTNTSGATAAVTATTVTGMLGVGGANTLTYSGVGTLRINPSTNASVVNSTTVTSPGSTAFIMSGCGGGAGGDTVSLGANCSAAVSLFSTAGRTVHLASNGHSIASGTTGFSGITLTDALNVLGVFNVSGGNFTFDANNQNVTVGGLATISITTYLASTGAHTFNGGLTVSSAGAFTGSSGDVHVNGTFTLSGTATFTAPSGAFTVSGNWTTTGTPTFTAGTGTVTLNGTNQTISGSTTFYNLIKTVSAADTLTFTDGTTQTVSHALTLQGASGQLLTLAGTSTAGWTIAVPATQTLDHLSVSYSTATGNTAAAGSTSTNGGHNSGWTFGSSTPGRSIFRGGILKSPTIQGIGSKCP